MGCLNRSPYYETVHRPWSICDVLTGIMIIICNPYPLLTVVLYLTTSPSLIRRDPNFFRRPPKQRTFNVRVQRVDVDFRHK